MYGKVISKEIKALQTVHMQGWGFLLMQDLGGVGI